MLKTSHCVVFVLFFCILPSQFDCCSSSLELRMMVLPEVSMAQVALDDLDSSLEMANSV